MVINTTSLNLHVWVHACGCYCVWNVGLFWIISVSIIYPNESQLSNTGPGCEINNMSISNAWRKHFKQLKQHFIQYYYSITVSCGDMLITRGGAWLWLLSTLMSVYYHQDLVKVVHNLLTKLLNSRKIFTSEHIFKYLWLYIPSQRGCSSIHWFPRAVWGTHFRMDN